MEKLKPRLQELFTTLFRTLILIIETFLKFIETFLKFIKPLIKGTILTFLKCILTFLKFIKTTIQSINARIGDGKKFTPLMFWTFVLFIALPVFLAIFFPPPVRSLSFDPFNVEVLHFQPKIPKNPIRKIEVNLPKETLHGSATIKAVIATEYLEDGTDINKLAVAVAKAETGDGKFGYGKEYNNVHGIKNGKTAPCNKIGRNRMCIYESKDESYQSFKKIWKKWYKKYPTPELAKKYSNDRAETWLKNVNYYYELL